MKFSPKCRTKKLGMINTVLGSFCSFFNWEGTVIRPQIRPRKILDSYKINLLSRESWKKVVTLSPLYTGYPIIPTSHWYACGNQDCFYAPKGTLGGI